MDRSLDLNAPTPYRAEVRDADDAFDKYNSVALFGPGLSVIVDVPKDYNVANCREVVRKILLALPSPVVMP